MTSQFAKSIQGRDPAGATPAMWSTILVLWIVLMTLVASSLLRAVNHESFGEQFLAAAYYAFLALALFLGLHQAAAAVFGYFFRRDEQVGVSPPTDEPVAVLYATRNDFNQEAARSCVHQDYGRYHVFILDDSSDEDYRTQVDDFHLNCQSVTTVIRRTNLQGFKAGNLNHALDLIGGEYPYFALADSDTRLPPDFLAKAVPALTNTNYAFAQASVRINRLASDCFQESLGSTHQVYWRIIMPAAARFGFLMLHGHSAVVRTSAWREVGGFPELVAEDLAFSTSIRARGHRGVYLPDLICEEDYPPRYQAFAVRHRKYCRGAMEHLVRQMPAFLASPNVPWFEKLDRLSSSLNLIFPFFLIGFGASIALCRTILHLSPMVGSTIRAVGALVLVAPLLPMFIGQRNMPIQILRNTADALAGNLSLVVTEFAESIGVLCWRRSSFVPTGDRSAVEADGIRNSLASSIVLSGAMALSAALWHDVSWLPIAAALAVGVLTRRFGWGHPMTRATRPIPLLCLMWIVLSGSGFDPLMAGAIGTTVSLSSL